MSSRQGTGVSKQSTGVAGGAAVDVGVKLAEQLHGVVLRVRLVGVVPQTSDLFVGVRHDARARLVTLRYTHARTHTRHTRTHTHTHARVCLTLYLTNSIFKLLHFDSENLTSLPF